MVFLAVKTKTSASVKVADKLKPFILEVDEGIAKDLETLRIQRTQAVEATFTTESRLISYYKSLCVVENRFPLFNRTGIFTWSEAYKPESMAATGQKIQVEKSSVLFNLAATYSVIGRSNIPKTLGDDVINRSRAFTYSANIFSYMKKKGLTIQGGTKVDLSTECISLLENLMLAQAQERALEEVVLLGDEKQCASKQVGLYYHEVLTRLHSPKLISYFGQTFKEHLQNKVDVFHSDENSTVPLSLVTVDTSVVESWLDASKESIFASAVPAGEKLVAERMGNVIEPVPLFSDSEARSKMIDEAATAKGKDLKRDGESLELPEAKRQKSPDSSTKALAKMLAEALSIGKTPEVIMDELEIKAPLFNDNLARIKILLEVQKVAVEKSLDEFKQELKNLCEAYHSKNHTAADGLISRLKKHVKSLRVEQEMEIVDAFDTVFKEMSKFNGSIGEDAAFEGKGNLLSLFSTKQLTNLQEIFGFLLNMKTGRNDYKTEDMSGMEFNEIVAQLELAYAKDDFPGCESLLGGLGLPIMRLRLGIPFLVKK